MVMKTLTLPIFAVWLVSVGVGVFYVFQCPFTKVEESFNLQAIHDHIYHGLNVSQFDHVEFTGPLPRTFIGNIVIGYATLPISMVLGNAPKLHVQYAARLVLMSLVLLSYLHFLCSVKRLYSSAVAVWSCLILCTQFHFLFYVSRTLPNTFALVPALLAMSCWLRSWWRGFVFFSGFAIIVFRCELALLFGLMLLISLFYGRLNIGYLLLCITCAGLFSLGATVLIDSFYWQQWVWPEGYAFYFNAILNKSSEWGTSPFLWYFYSALPRAMGSSLLLVPLGLAIDTRCLVMSAPAFGFLLLYSLLPHKELRFILYVVPLLNVPAARACSVIWNNKRKSADNSFAALAVLAHLLINVIITAFLFKLSFHNYPGGYGLQYLNSHHNPAIKTHLNIDVYSAQTGVSRFLHEHNNWRYDKTEDKQQVMAKVQTYDYLLVGTPDEPEIDHIIEQYTQTHRPLHTEMCFKNIHLNQGYPFINVRLAPCVWLLQLRD